MENNLSLAVARLIKTYNYQGALEILDLFESKETYEYLLIESCKCSMNFDFGQALSIAQQIPVEFIRQNASIKRYVDELPSLQKGDPNEVFNELMDNIVIQLKKEAFTEFAGRVFQLRELLYKFAVIQYKEKKAYSLRDRIYEKKFFEHRFKLHHGLMNGMKEVLVHGGGKWEKIVQVLSGKTMSELMDLRHKTIVAHGIETIRIQDIEHIYHSPENVLNEIELVFDLLNIPRRKHKYKGLNRGLIAILVQE